ncbi:MAG: hypothetical protein RMH75_07225 [Archaeoglobaceae archaeon]|nr:hypothetical protein [Archaeoglobaceae archaeon]
MLFYFFLTIFLLATIFTILSLLNKAKIIAPALSAVCWSVITITSIKVDLIFLHNGTIIMHSDSYGYTSLLFLLLFLVMVLKVFMDVVR